MRLTLYRLTFHENLFYATREAGRLYETGRYLHNYALTYALGLASAPYHHLQQIPSYAEELSPLNEQGVYVTPARGMDVRYQLVTFKFADNAYRVKMEQSSRNLPTFGRAKEIAVGSVFEFGVLHSGGLRLPRWIRMGLWRSKGLVEVIGEAELKPIADKEQTASLPLNPLDVPGEFRLYDLISMPPSSLAENAVIETEWLKADIPGREPFLLPAGMRYTFPEAQPKLL
ncbi:MAG: type I-D CRISPR-associated protein Cas5/Csc1 [Anaerolineales bacterium]|nr:type I-D CRISPR-associated protein Cas5/Csc1 [Anaerolineales bacterium]